MTAGVVVAVLVVGVIGYAAVGFVYATTRISSADHTLNTVISHQNTLNATFKGIDSQLATLTNNATFNAVQARTLIDQSVIDSQHAVTTVDEDDSSLAAAAQSLQTQRWLTTFSRPSLDHESDRIAHARKALAKARVVASDTVQDARFWQSLFDVLADLDTMTNQISSYDLAGAGTTLTAMKSHVAQANQRASAPGLPSELQSLTVDMQTLVADFGKMLAAAQAGNDSGVSTAEAAVQADLSKISAYDFDKIRAEIDAFYKPLLDGFNSEMAAATA